MKTEIANRILALRAEMKKAGVDAVIIPQTDPHQSEYLAAHWQVRRWLSGFTGSAGDLVVTADDALLWTDSRYFLQAARQLEDTDIKLMKDGLPDTPSINHYLTHTLKKGAKVGIDGALFNLGTVCALRGVLEKRGMTLATDFDATDTIWEDRPDLPEAMVFVHDVKYAGETAASKIAKILAEAAEQGANATLVSALDEIAWTLNIRSRDVNCNPVATAFLYLSAKGSILFIKPEKIDDATAAYLKEAGVSVLPYSEVYSHMSSLPADTLVLVDATRTSVKAIDSLGSRAVVGASPIPMLKATKNDVQIAGIRKSMEIDGAALVGAFMEIEKRMAEGTKLTEMDVADILTHFRSQQPGYFDLSFETIAGYGPHGAIVHYEATPETDSTIEPHGLLLIDSGAQYLTGTTDITRTIAMGAPTAEEKRDFTLVMKGHIALGTAITASINSLVNSGYTVSSYGNDVVYLNDVPQLNYYWPDAALYYNNGRLYGSQFTYSSPYYDMNRYNTLYNTLMMQYGAPVQVVNNGPVCSATWYGAGNRYVTLSFNSGYSGQFYTCLLYTSDAADE